MKRRQFLGNCAVGLCSCAIAGTISPTLAAASDKPASEDWCLGFVKKRYAELLEILAGKMDDAALDETLMQLGACCASTLPMIEQYKGDIDGFIREFAKRFKMKITYDREKGIITSVGKERNDCGCPLINKSMTPPKACNCSLGYTKYTYETILGKKVQAELKESILHGDKRCTFVTRVLDSPLQEENAKA